MEPTLLERLPQLPAEPGIYLMKDKRGRIVYIGKASNLRGRVRSYFNRSGDNRYFIPLLADLLGDIETLVVGNETEALLLENQLIKRHQPRFNVKLKDDKNFLHIRLDTRHAWPRAQLVRNIARDGARYFGPYDSASAVRRVLQVLNRHFQLRTCSDRVLATRGRPCLLYQIKRCPAPCVFPVDEQEYARNVGAAQWFLEGRRDALVEQLTLAMAAASEALEFERAARLRDQLRDIRRVLVRQEVVLTHGRDQDIFGFAREGELAVVQLLSVRDGHLRDTRRFPLKGMTFPDTELLSSFVNLFYDGGPALPDEVVVPFVFEDAAAKELWLSKQRGRKVRVIRPRRGPRRHLLQTACRNAVLALEQLGNDVDQRGQVLESLRAKLRLERCPRIMECVDISLFQGSEAVGSVVRFKDGLPDSNGYRRYRIRRVTGTDDFAMMYEVLNRHLRRRMADDALPDLLVVDGGKGQLNVARAALADLEISSIELAGLAKARLRSTSTKGVAQRSPESIFRPERKDPIILSPRSAELHLLMRLRDEAHRFAITYHRKRRKKRTLRSILDDIPGVGPARRKALLKRFGSVAGLRKAPASAIAAVPGIGAALASVIHDQLGEKP